MVGCRSDEHDKQVEKVYPTVPLTQKRAAEGRQRFHTNVLSYSTLFKGFVLPASPGTKARVLRAFFAAGTPPSSFSLSLSHTHTTRRTSVRAGSDGITLQGRKPAG